MNKESKIIEMTADVSWAKIALQRLADESPSLETREWAKEELKRELYNV
tara:strand:+ start:776 stop:922 length:147 start_codon:yes stop_codon:yes gene_type:complete